MGSPATVAKNWSAREIAELRTKYGLMLGAELAAHFNTTPASIYQAVARYGIKAAESGLSLRELCERYKLPRRAMSSLIESGVLRATFTGWRYVITPQDVRTFEEQWADYIPLLAARRTRRRVMRTMLATAIRKEDSGETEQTQYPHR